MARYELPRGYLSASALETMAKCPKMYEFRYIKNIKKPQNLAMSIGSITHKSFETYYNQAIEGERLSSKVLVEYTNDQVIPDYFSDTEVVATAKDIDNVRKIVPGLTVPYVDNVGVRTDPIATEEEIRFTTPSGVPILAFLDLRKKVGENGEAQGIADYKITGRYWTMNRLQNSLQFNLYSYITGVREVEVHNILKDKPPKSRTPLGEGVSQPAENIRVFKNRFDVSDEWMDSYIERYAAQITAGIFPPGNIGEWWCSKEFCDYWDLCRGKRY